MERTVIELFAGVGGFRVGLNNVTEIDKNGKARENGNWKFVWANQWEPSTKSQHAFDCYVSRFDNPGEFSNTDISLVDKRLIPDHSLLVGGFPCQDYSVARTKSNEKGIEGKKGVLFWQIAEILEVKKTPFVLLENVDRLLKTPAFQRGRDFGIMLRTFHDLGYNVEWRVINAADYSAPQRRRRIFIFAWRKDTSYQESITHFESKSLITENGLFANSFKIDLCSPKFELSNKINITELSDTVEMTSKFEFSFLNTGIMIDGNVMTQNTKPKFEAIRPLSEILTSVDSEEYFLTDNQIEKFSFLKNGKRIERTKPNGELYFYTEGGMSFPDSLSLPGRTMLTSEGTVNRSTHVVKDKTGKLRFITPIEAERLQCFPDDWTNTGMPKSRRYFMMGNALVTSIVNRMESSLFEIITNNYPISKQDE